MRGCRALCTHTSYAAVHAGAFAWSRRVGAEGVEARFEKYQSAPHLHLHHLSSLTRCTSQESIQWRPSARLRLWEGFKRPPTPHEGGSLDANRVGFVSVRRTGAAVAVASSAVARWLLARPSGVCWVVATKRRPVRQWPLAHDVCEWSRCVCVCVWRVYMSLCSVCSGTDGGAPTPVVFFLPRPRRRRSRMCRAL